MGTITHKDADDMSVPEKVQKSEWKATTTHLDSQGNTLELARSATITVAANDSASKSKAGADYLCDNVDDNVQIQAAMDALPAAGGSIYLAEGNYTLAAKLTPPSSCYLYGTRQAVINGASDANPFEINGKSNVTLRGFTIDGDYGDGVILLGTLSDITLQDLEIADVGQSGVEIYPVDTIMKRIKLKDLYIHDTGHSGIYGASSTGQTSSQVIDLLIDGCHCDTNGSSTGEWHGGIVIERWGTTENSIKIANSYIEDGYESGVHIETVDGMVQIDNVISKGNGARKASPTYATGFKVTKSNVMLSNCFAIGNTRNGFGLTPSATYTYVVIADSCVSYNNGWYGFSFTLTDNDGTYKTLTLSNSNAYGNTLSGLALRASASLDEIPYLIAIHNNTIAGNLVGQTSGAELVLVSNGGSPYSYARNVSIRGNKIFPSNALVSAITISGTSPVIEGNEIGTDGAATIVPGGGSTGTIIRNNTGYITENSGTATVASGDTTVVVSHGLSVAPDRVTLTATLWSNAAKAWVTTKTATQFTINVDADPGASTATFDWRAVKGEAYA